MFEKILFPTDFSDVSKKAFESIKQLKGAGTRKVVILHVIDSRFFEAVSWHPTKEMAELEKDIIKEIYGDVESMKNELEQIGIEVKVRIETGVPFSKILRVEEEEKVTAMVIGSHGVSNIEEMLMGSVSEKVIRKAKKPVLVVKR
ncbi:MAG: universal stress protein [Deltaproteobacteria bacterium]|nr:universal stress protein [Deltaproteobacteria bacterium]